MIRLAPAGTSDILGVLPNGKFIALEAKVGNNKATLKQLEFLAKVIRNGGHGIVFYSLKELKDYWKGGWKSLDKRVTSYETHIAITKILSDKAKEK